MGFQMIIAIASLITSVGTILAVLIARKSFLADHERRKKQATIEFYSQLSLDATVPLRKAISKALNQKYGESTYKQIHPDSPEWENNEELQIAFIYYCRCMERFAVGISNGVFHFETFNSFSGWQTALLFEQIKPLIEYYDEKNKKHNLCKEFKTFYNDLLQAHIPSKEKMTKSHIP